MPEAGCPLPLLSLGIVLGLSESDQLLHLDGTSEETERRGGHLVLVLETEPRARGRMSSGAVASRGLVSALSLTSLVTAPPVLCSCCVPLQLVPVMATPSLGLSPWPVPGGHLPASSWLPQFRISVPSPSPLGWPLACWGLHHFIHAWMSSGGLSRFRGLLKLWRLRHVGMFSWGEESLFHWPWMDEG